MVKEMSTIEFPVSFFKGIALIQMTPQFCVQEAVEFKALCNRMVSESTNLKQIVLDFGRTTFMDSSGIGALVSTIQIFQQKNIPIACWSLRDQPKMVISMSSLDQLFAINERMSGIFPTQAQVSRERPQSAHPAVRSKIKRVIDIVGSLVGLTITGCLFPFIALAIYLDDPGPILFSQIRCGWMGKRFRIWKFRSMVVNAEKLKHQVENQLEGPMFKNERDPRITKVGRFLRRTSLDELPQFWNVLRGDMSLIGTRPPTPNELEQYEVPNWQRLDVKPGISGEWQVNGRSNVRKFEDVIRMDLQYQQNWSLLYDLQLILKTVLVVFKKDQGAL